MAAGREFQMEGAAKERATAISRINTGDNEKLLVVGAERPCSRVRGEKFMKV